MSTLKDQKLLLRMLMLAAYRVKGSSVCKKKIKSQCQDSIIHQRVIVVSNPTGEIDIFIRILCFVALWFKKIDFIRGILSYLYIEEISKIILSVNTLWD